MPEKKQFTAQDYADFLQTLQEHSDDGYRQYTEKVIPGIGTCYGVRSPKFKKICDHLTKNFDCFSMIEFFYDPQYNTGTYDETQALGAIIGKTPFAASQELFTAIRRYIPLINNWAICDSFVGKLQTFFPKWQSEFWQEIPVYLASENPWEIRLGLILIHSYFSKPENVDAIFQRISPITSEHYYVKMGMAWMLSMLYLQNKIKVIELMQQHITDKWTFNKTIQKIKESRQVEAAEKEYLTTLKIK